MDGNSLIRSILKKIKDENEIFGIPQQYSDTNFKAYLKDRLEGYYAFLKQSSISRQLNTINNLVNNTSYDFQILNKVGGLITTLNNGIESYYNGQPNKFYNSFHTSMTKIVNFQDNVVITNIEPNALFYRLRLSKEKITANHELFHIPFELRKLCSTQRYSIPGLPSLYLGSTVKVCSHELMEKSFNSENYYSSLFKTQKFIPIIEIMTLDELERKFNDNLSFTNRIDLLLRYILLFPLYLACSIKVKDDGVFKPEYIIPQFLLQYVTSFNTNGQQGIQIKGIKFPSTKVDKFIEDDPDHYNLVLPIVKSKDLGYCDSLCEDFNVTRPKKLSALLRKKEIEKSYKNYNDSDFYRIEIRLSKEIPEPVMAS